MVGGTQQTKPTERIGRCTLDGAGKGLANRVGYRRRRLALSRVPAGLVGFVVLSSPLLLYCYAQSWGNNAHEGSPEYWLTYAVFVACTGCEALTGASVGKWVVTLRVLDAKTMGPVHWRASARWLLKLLPV